jgi:general secretion pathway protein L
MADYTYVRTVTESPSGLWRLQGEEVGAVDRSWAGPLTVLVPSELVMIKPLDLPFPSRARRAEAAPFALEGLIGEPLDQVHVALGVEVSAGRHLCAVVRHSVMRHWLGLLGEVGLDRCVLMPDALALPLPPPGSWRLNVAGGRALLRTDDGGGFAVEVGMLPTLWDSAGRPMLIAEGEPLPQAMSAGLAEVSIEGMAGQPVAVIPPLDLRQGLYALPREARGGAWRTAGLIALAGAAAHLAIAAIDTTALHMMAERREAETRALIATRDPGASGQPDLVAVVDRLVPATAGGDGPFVQTLARAAAVLGGRPLTYRAIVWGGAQGTTTLAVTAPDMATVEAAAASLTAQALPATAALDPVAEAGAATTGLNAVITVQTGQAGQ